MLVEEPLEMLLICEVEGLNHDPEEIRLFSPPFTIHELRLSIKSYLKLTGEVKLEYENAKFHKFLPIKSFDDIAASPRVIKVSVNPNKPWVHPSNKRWYRPDSSSCERVQVIKHAVVEDKEIGEVLQEFLNKMQPATTCKIVDAFAIKSDSGRTISFEQFIKDTALRQRQTSDLFLSRSWETIKPNQRSFSKSDQDRTLRFHFSDFLQNYSSQFKFNEENLAQVLLFLESGLIFCEQLILNMLSL